MVEQLNSVGFLTLLLCPSTCASASFTVVCACIGSESTTNAYMLMYSKGKASFEFSSQNFSSLFSFVVRV